MKLYILYFMVALTFALATALPQHEPTDEEVFHSAEEDVFHSAEDDIFHSAEEEIFYSAEENPGVKPKLKPKPKQQQLEI